ncbi:MAG: hypothetical protein COW56_08925, partial [Rhodocyclales bacterium CG17_big_fil_post_rev_8_21_14_2_50_68_7]
MKLKSAPGGAKLIAGAGDVNADRTRHRAGRPLVRGTFAATRASGSHQHGRYSIHSVVSDRPAALGRKAWNRGVRLSKTQCRVADRQPASGARRSPERLLDGLRVLVVDDDPVSRGFARKLLGTAGAEVEIAENGLRALEVLDSAESQCFDAVLMDIEMPAMDGLEATRRLRSQPRFAHLPIIALTAHAVVVECHCCIEAGMDDHVIKPFSAVTLVEVVAHWTSRAARGPAGAITERAAGVLEADAALARLDGNHEFYSRVAG